MKTSVHATTPEAMRAEFVADLDRRIVLAKGRVRIAVSVRGRETAMGALSELVELREMWGTVAIVDAPEGKES